MRILIVDDNATDLKLLDVVLRTWGHETLLAGTAEEALTVVMAGLPDMVVLDMQLPESDGLCFIRWMREDLRTRSVPIVALTAYPDHFARADLAAIGCFDLMVKPIDTRALPHALDLIATKHSHSAREPAHRR